MKKIMFSLFALFLCFAGFSKGTEAITSPQKQKSTIEVKSSILNLDSKKWRQSHSSSIKITYECCSEATAYIEGFPIFCRSCAPTCDGPNGAIVKVADCLIDHAMMMQYGL